MLTPEQFIVATGKLTEIVDKQERVIFASKNNDFKQGVSVAGSLLEMKKNLERNLSILVVGRCCSGKSTFLNAMIGKVLLPAKSTPTAAVIGEIQYADESGTTFYDEVQKALPYERIVIKYPLHICKMGIEFVDVPGLDEPIYHDSIMLNYLLTTDVVLYCINSQNAFSVRDKVEIERLRALGHKSMIFVLTYFDMLERNDKMTGRHDAEDTCRHYIDTLSPYTDLGVDGVFFVGSLLALAGKVKGNKEMLEASHLPPLEKRLEQILFNERGRLKLIKAVYSAKNINREVGAYLADVIELGKQDKAKLAVIKVNEAQCNLDKAREKAGLISVSFSDGINELIKGTEERIRTFFISEVLPDIEIWINEYVPSGEEAISVRHPKCSSRDFARTFSEDCMKFFQSKIETVISSWCSDELIPGYIEPKLESLVNRQCRMISAYETNLQNVRKSLSMSIIPDEQESSGTNRILSAIAGNLLLNPAVTITGGMLGWSVLLPTLISSIVANIILYIVAYFTGPVRGVTIIITDIVALIVRNTFDGDNIESKVRKRIALVLKTEIAKHQEEFVANVSSSIKDIVDKLKNAVDEELNNPISHYQSLLNEVRRSVNADGVTFKNGIVNICRILKDNVAILRELEDLDK